MSTASLISVNADRASGGPSVFSVDSRTITVELLHITPELSGKFLELNKNNRNLTSTKVDQIAADIKAGRFKFNGIPIIIDDRPEIVDGQHRLHGIVKADIAVPMLVVTGVAADVSDTIDTLCKTRSVSDILKMKYQHSDLKNRTIIDGIATLVLIGLTGNSNHNKPAVAAYADSVIDELSDWAAFGKAVQNASQNIIVQRHMVRSSMSASSVGALGIVMVRNGASADLVRDFLMRIATGNVSDSDTTGIIPAIRRRQSGGILLGGSGRSQFTAVFTEFATYITAYNKWVAGEQQQQIRGYPNPIRKFAALPVVSRIGA